MNRSSRGPAPIPMPGGIATALVRLANRPGGDRPRAPARLARRVLDARYRADRRLAVYGSLAPGRSNHDKLARLQGTWRRGVVYGYLEDRGWGAAMGYPALRWDPRGTPVDVWVLTSPDLARHWHRLDAFEGDEYVRRLVPVYRGTRLMGVANCFLAGK